MPKAGKTTLATSFPNHLLVAFELGYNAIPGVMAQPVAKWSEFLKILKQLDSDEAKEMFKIIIIDTGDLAYDACETYVCDINGVDTIADIPYGEQLCRLAW